MNRSPAARWFLLPALLLAGCATQWPGAGNAPGGGKPVGVTPAMLVRGEPLTGGREVPPLPPADILGLDPAMRRFVAERVPAGGPGSWRLRELLRALLRDDGFHIEYQERTYTAAEAFQLRRANCLAFTNLFVALAREAGLTVRFQEVDVPADWSSRGDLLIQNRHINTNVDLGRGREQIVDFNMADFRSTYDAAPRQRRPGPGPLLQQRGRRAPGSGGVGARTAEFPGGSCR